MGKKGTSNLAQELAGASPELLEFSERTEWQERMIVVRAKAFALKVLVIGGMITLCICAWRSENTSETIHAVMPIISGILSFFAGRLSR